MFNTDISNIEQQNHLATVLIHIHGSRKRTFVKTFHFRKFQTFHLQFEASNASMMVLCSQAAPIIIFDRNSVLREVISEAHKKFRMPREE